MALTLQVTFQGSLQLSDVKPEGETDARGSMVHSFSCTNFTRGSHLSLHSLGIFDTIRESCASFADDVGVGVGKARVEALSAVLGVLLLLFTCRGNKTFTSKASKPDTPLAVRPSSVSGTAAVKAGVAQAAAVSIYDRQAPHTKS